MPLRNGMSLAQRRPQRQRRGGKKTAPLHAGLKHPAAGKLRRAIIAVQMNAQAVGLSLRTTSLPVQTTAETTGAISPVRATTTARLREAAHVVAEVSGAATASPAHRKAAGNAAAGMNKLFDLLA